MYEGSAGSSPWIFILVALIFGALGIGAGINEWRNRNYGASIGCFALGAAIVSGMLYLFNDA